MLNFRLLPTDQHGARPWGHLFWGYYVFCCALCGQPVFLTPDESDARPLAPGEASTGLALHHDCVRVASQYALAGQAAKISAAAAAEQRTWELRAQLN